MLLDWLKLPETRHPGDLNHPDRTVLHGRIIRGKGFLRRLYRDFYTQIKNALEPIADHSVIVELGSGGGFIKDILPEAITSEILDVPGVDRVFSALDMPFEDHSVDAFCMIDVFHHLPDAHRFLSEANRCLRPGGRVVMIEPANTFFSRFIYRHAHHEPFEPHADWTFDSTGPLSDANGALPWTVFFRDRRMFQQQFPNLTITSIHYHTPLRYLLSGGLTWRQLLPDACYGLIVAAEWLLGPLSPWCGLFMTITLQKDSDSGDPR